MDRYLKKLLKNNILKHLLVLAQKLILKALIKKKASNHHQNFLQVLNKTLYLNSPHLFKIIIIKLIMIQNNFHRVSQVQLIKFMSIQIFFLSQVYLNHNSGPKNVLVFCLILKINKLIFCTN